MPEEPEEQLEFLRREDIRTMAKDTARLREEESKKERERIVQLQGGKAAAPSQGQPATTPEPSKTPLMPSSFEAIGGELPRPLSQKKKTLVRVAVVLLVLFVVANAVALAYSLWGRPAPQEAQTQTPAPTPPAAEAPTQQEQSSLPFPVGKIVTVSSAKDISKLLTEELPQGITGVSFSKDVQTPLAMLGIDLSEQVRPLVHTSFLLFLHTLGEKKRFGVAFTINGTEAAVKEAALQWEPNMERNMAPFFQLMGGPGAGYIPSFKSTQHNGVAVRFQTFSKNDFGIVYAVSHNLFLVTSSLESMNVLLDTLEKPAL